MRKLGDYVIEGSLGAGGMGVVLKGRAPDGRVVAIKLVQRPSEDTLQRFEREKRLLAAFGYEEGFVPLLDAGDAPQGSFLVMPLIEGGTLRQRLEEDGKLPLGEAMRIGRRIVESVARAHERGIVHRDLKPENILFTNKGAPLVADLGLAKHFRREDLGGSKSLTLTASNEFKGTMCYMAPEQMKDARAAGPPADVFALGCIIYECLAGQPVFENTDVLVLIERVTTGDHVPLRRVRPEVPVWLEAAIERALRPDAAERPADARDLLRALSGPKARRMLLPAIAGGALVGGAAFTLGLAFHLGRNRPRPEPPSPRPAVVASETPAPSRPTVDAALNAMRQAFDRKEWPAVIEHATRLLALDPTVMRAHTFRAEAYTSLGRHEEALADYAAVAESTYDSVALRLGRGRAYFHLKRWDEALADFDRAMELGADDTIAFALRGAARLKKGDSAGAVADLDVAIARGAAVADDYGNRATARLQLGRPREAIEDFDAALVLSPQRDDLLTNRGLAWKALGEHARAIADFDAALVLVPGAAVYHCYRGMSLLALKDHARAREALERSLELDPRNDNAWITLGLLFEELKDDAAAVGCYDKGIAAQPGNWRCYVQRANVENRQGKHAQAIEDTTKALSIDDRIGAAYLARGNARNDSGDHAGAVLDHTKAIENGVLLGYKNRALARKSLDDQKGAVADLEKFFELHPDRPADDPARTLLRVWKFQLEHPSTGR